MQYGWKGADIGSPLADMQTAQVASQQGKYLGQLFGKLKTHRKALAANDLPDMDDEVYTEAFNYRHLGNLAYIGNSCVSALLLFAASSEYHDAVPVLQSNAGRFRSPDASQRPGSLTEADVQCGV
jgi:hypothetical protein